MSVSVFVIFSLSAIKLWLRNCSLVTKRIPITVLKLNRKHTSLTHVVKLNQKYHIYYRLKKPTKSTATSVINMTAYMQLLQSWWPTQTCYRDCFYIKYSNKYLHLKCIPCWQNATFTQTLAMNKCNPSVRYVQCFCFF